jgi:NAD(P)-dependent dehydrogenase (short-subunit alcohol dehydrogenase family)
MACRDLKKAEDAAAEIRMATGGREGAGDVVVMQLDLSSLTSVREFAANVLRTESRIHLLVNNAGNTLLYLGIIFDRLHGQKTNRNYRSQGFQIIY